ncbi:MAG: hypothetical protein GYA60_04215 [Candidatus Methanofastidiosa archaeon]|nr:hypothetical protein [Candidatus Methanofastidiosa archaeon]
MKKDIYNPIFIGIILFIVILLVGILFGGTSNLFRFLQYDISLAIAQILATIFAITISLTIFGFQYLGEGSSPRIIGSYIKRPFITLLIFLYLISIVGILLFVHFQFLSSALIDLISISALILCLSALVSYLFYMANILQPSEIINEIIKKIPDDFYKELKGKKTYEILDGVIDTNIVEIEQILIKAVRGNDYYSFVSGLESMTQKIITIITNANKDPDFGEEDSLNLPYFFLAIYKRIYHEIKKEENDIFIYKYIQNIFNIINTAYGIKYGAMILAYFNHFKEIGNLLIEKDYYSTFSSYFNLMDQILINEYNSDITEFYLVPSVIEDIDFVTKIAIDATSKKQTKVVELSKDLLSKLLIKTLEDESKGQSNSEQDSKIIGDSYSDQIVDSILPNLEKIHNESCNKNIDIGFFSNYFYPQIIHSIKNKDIGELHSDNITRYFCKSCVYSTEKGLNSGIYDFTNIDIKFFRLNLELTQIIVPYLFKCLEIAKEKSNDKYYHIQGRIYDIWWNFNERRQFDKNLTKEEYKLMTEINQFIEKENKKFKIDLHP